jgi:hypothetical protein
MGFSQPRNNNYWFILYRARYAHIADSDKKAWDQHHGLESLKSKNLLITGCTNHFLRLNESCYNLYLNLDHLKGLERDSRQILELLCQVIKNSSLTSNL